MYGNHRRMLTCIVQRMLVLHMHLVTTVGIVLYVCLVPHYHLKSLLVLFILCSESYQ